MASSLYIFSLISRRFFGPTYFSTYLHYYFSIFIFKICFCKINKKIFKFL